MGIKNFLIIVKYCDSTSIYFLSGIIDSLPRGAADLATSCQQTALISMALRLRAVDMSESKTFGLYCATVTTRAGATMASQDQFRFRNSVIPRRMFSTEADSGHRVSFSDFTFTFPASRYHYTFMFQVQIHISSQPFTILAWTLAFVISHPSVNFAVDSLWVAAKQPRLPP